jgi:hypothetical protein
MPGNPSAYPRKTFVPYEATLPVVDIHLPNDSSPSPTREGIMGTFAGKEKRVEGLEDIIPRNREDLIRAIQLATEAQKALRETDG